MKASGIFKTQRIHTLVLSGFGLLLVLGLATSLFLLFELRQTLQEGEAIDAAKARVLTSMHELHVDFIAQELNRVLLSKEPQLQLEKWRAEMLESDERTAELLQAALASTHSEELRRVLSELQEHDEEITDPIEQGMLTMAGTDVAAAREMYLTQFLPSQDKNLELLNEAKRLAVEEVDAMALRSQAQAGRAQFWSGLAIAVFLGLGIATAFFLTRVVGGLMRRAGEAADRAKESEEKFQQLADNVTDVFWICSPDFKTMHYVSPGYENIWGRSTESLYANPQEWAEAILPEQRSGVYATFAKLATVETKAMAEFQIVRPDGTVRWILSRGFQVRDASGQVIRTSGIASDITERKQAADELRESDRRFSNMLGNLELVSMMLDCEARITYCNDFLLQLTGWQRHEVIGRNWFDLFLPPDLVDELHDVHSALLENQPSAWHHENEIVTRSGERRLIRWNNSVLRSPSGEPIGTASIGEDITEQKQQEGERQRLQQFQQALLDSIGHGVHGIDNTGRIIFENPAAARMLGWAPNKLTGRPAHATMHHSHDDGSSYPVEECPIHATLKDGELRRINSETFWRADGTSFPVEFTVAPIRDTSDKIKGAVVAFADITERQRAESELTRAKEAAEAANLAKSEFLANMSHEIRTPMNGIIGMTELVLETTLDRTQREYLGMAKSSAHSLLNLINDILDFSKIEAGKLEMEAISFSLRDCIGAMLKPLGMRADQKGLELTADISSRVPDHLIGDPMRLRQILTNLIDNAIKFTERGDVILGVTVDSATGEKHWLHFSVTDSGVGIPAEKQALVFEAFAQADGTTTRNYGGTGLGLSIALRLVRQMGGRIWVESTVGEGTAFHFTVQWPVRPTPAPNVRHADISELEGMRVLVVDDNAVNRRILRDMLANWRMQPAVVASGAAAIVEMLRAAHDGTPFPLVILDGMMPEMDGFMVAEKIREHTELSGATVMMLSSAMPAGAAARCAELGVASYLTKPVLQSELLDAILIALGARTQSESSVPANTNQADGGGLHILVAEDNLINRAVAVGILGKHGHAIAHAANGREAVAAVARESFDLIFMDVQMPEMDGFEATRRIRELEKVSGTHTRIIAMTAHALAGDRERCLAAGMDDYLSKPLRKEDLLRTLEGASMKGDHPQSGTRSLYSREQLLAQCDGDEELMSELIAIFCENTPPIVRTIGEAVEKRDAPALTTQSHKLLSSMGTFGADRARSLALRLEAQGRENNFRGAKERVRELERETDKIYAALAGFRTVLA